MRPINCLCIHHSASATGSVEVFRYEHKAKGWLDIGYHSVISNGHGGPDGLCRQGRPDTIKGSAVYGHNTGLLSVCLVGQFSHEAPGYCGPTAEQLHSLGEWLLHRAVRYNCTTVRGHKEVALPHHGTLCPGDLRLELIRAWFAKELRHYRLFGHPIVSLAEFLPQPR